VTQPQPTSPLCRGQGLGSRVSAWESVGIVSVPTGAPNGSPFSAHDYAFHLGQLGEFLSTPTGRAVAEELTRPARVAEAREASRAERYQRQRDLSPLYPEPMRACHRKRFVRGEVAITVSEEGNASYCGIVSCNRRSGCEHCGPRLLARDAELVEALVKDHGYERTLMATLTVRHWRALALKPLRRGLANAFRRMLQHRDWRERDALVNVQIVRSLEVTDGPHGWHPHLHVLLLLEAELSDEARESLEALLARLWLASVERVMGRAYRPTLAHGLDLSPCHAADYITKLGLEVADAGQSKRARNVKGRTYWQLRTEWIARGRHCDDEDATRIREYLDGMLGAKIVTWGKGLKARAAALAPEPVIVERERATLLAEEFDAIRDMRSDDGCDARAALLRVAELADPGEVDRAVRVFLFGLRRESG
jgi:Replication protein